MGKIVFEAGALVRHQVRRELTINEFDWEEVKGFFTSTFIVRGTYDQIRTIHNWVRGNGGRAR